MVEGVRSNQIAQASVIDELLGNTTQDGIVGTVRIATAALGVQIAQGAGAIVAKQIKSTFGQLDAIKGMMGEGDVGLVMFDEDEEKRGRYAKEGGVLVWKEALTETQSAAAAALAKQYRDEALAVAPSFWEGILSDTIEARSGALDEADRSTGEANRSETEAVRAEAARDAATVYAGPVYLTVQSGIDAVLDTQQFTVVSADGKELQRRRRDSAIASTLISSLPTTCGLDSRVGFRTAPGYLLAFLDGLGRHTGLELRDSDGLFTDYARDGQIKRIEEVRHLPQLASVPGFLLALLDGNRKMTDLTIKDTDGQFADFVVERLAPRIAEHLEIPTPAVIPSYRWPDVRGSTTTIKPKDTWVRDHEVLTVLPNMTRMMGLGSSTMAAFGGNFAAMAAGYGATYTNMGKGGELLEHTLARLGSRPALLTFSGNLIPASGSVVVTCSNMPVNASQANWQSYAGTVGFGGVAGTISATATTVTWTRTTPGTAVAVDPDMAFLPTLGGQCRADVALFNIGKNTIVDLPSGKKVAEEVDRAFDWMAPLVKRIVIIGQFPDGFKDPAGEERKGIDYVNNWQRNRYGAQFADFQAYLCSTKLWADYKLVVPGFAGPTADDLAQQAIGNKPPSASADAGHLNTDGYTTSRMYFFKPFIDGLSWF